MSLNLEQTTELLQSLSQFFELTPFSDSLARLEIKRDITTDLEGHTIPAGIYLIDADGIIYDPEAEGRFAAIQITKLAPLRTASGETMKLANLIFYIGEYMKIPDKANAILGNYFPKDPLLEALQQINLPEQIVLLNDKVTKQFFNNLLPAQKRPHYVDSGSTPDGVITPTVTISLLDLPPGVNLSRDITPFDGEVFTAVTTLFEAGTKRFTGQAIYRVMTGNPHALASSEKLQAIDESWTRLTSTAMKLDTGSVGTAYNFARRILECRVIEGRKDTVILRNQHGLINATLYSISEEPALKTYADAINQILRYPLEVRNTPVNKTLEIIVLQNYLLRHIATKGINEHALYSTMFSKIGLDDLNTEAKRRKQGRLRAQIKKMLKYWKDLGFISDWHEIKKNGSAYGIDIRRNTKKEGAGREKTP